MLSCLLMQNLDFKAVACELQVNAENTMTCVFKLCMRTSMWWGGRYYGVIGEM